MNVLIAEDDSVSRLILLTKLRKMGHEVIATEDGEALRSRSTAGKTGVERTVERNAERIWHLLD